MCDCSASESKLWTISKSYVSRRVEGNQIVSKWQCERCITPSAFCVGNLWQTTMITNGVRPSCPLGCISGPAHSAKLCRRSENRCILEIPFEYTESVLVLEMCRGLDFFKVWSCAKLYMVFMKLSLRDDSDRRQSAVGITTGICLLPHFQRGDRIPSTFRTQFLVDGQLCSRGETPISLHLLNAKIVSFALCNKECKPMGPFLGLTLEMWNLIWTSTCARRRYAPLIWGHTMCRDVPSASLPMLNSVKIQVLQTGIDAECERPFYKTISESEIACFYCKKVFCGETRLKDYYKTCVPDKI